VLDHVRKIFNGMQLKKLKSPHTAERAVSALTEFALKEIEGDAARKERLREYIPTFNLSYVVSEKMRGTVGWRDEWDDHVVHITDTLINDIEKAAELAWQSDKAIVDVSKTVDLDF
jgi:hypothetical protein